MPQQLFSKANASNSIRINFSNEGLREVIKSTNDLSATTPDKNVVVNAAKVLGDVVVEKTEPAGHQSVPQLLGLDYVGYIIEKERLNKTTGEWIRVDEYRILGSFVSSFKDSRVAYGNLYRYRIKSVLKATKKIPKISKNKAEDIKNLTAVKSNVIKQSILSKSTALENISKITDVGLKPKVSTGQSSVSIPLTENVSIKANEEGVNIVEKTLSSTTGVSLDVARQLSNSNIKIPSFLSGKEISNLQFQKMVNELLEISESATEEFDYVSYYYESLPSAKWFYVDTTESVAPPPPSSIQIMPNTPKKQIMVTWLLPGNSQRDIKSFRLYRRNGTFLSAIWQTVGDFNLRDNVYLDKNVEIGVPYIYALTCIDVHGFESVLSMQIEAVLNPRYSFEKAERALRWISGSGATPQNGDVVVYKKFLDPEIPIVAKKNIVIGPTTLFKDAQKKYIIKIKSLDIHEEKEFVVTLNNENVQESSE